MTTTYLEQLPSLAEQRRYERRIAVGGLRALLAPYTMQPARVPTQRAA